jgi:CAAX protease family protein
MPVFGSGPIEAVATIAVTFWYAWLFNHASGSSLLTLIAHATEGAVDTGVLWADAADTARHMGLYSVTWVAVAVVLLVANRRFWTRPPGPVDVHRPAPLRVGSGV